MSATLSTSSSSSSQTFTSSQTYCLRRNETQSGHFLDSVRQIFDQESLFDCTIVCEGKAIKGHKLILAAASEYFKSAFTSFVNPCQNTAVIVKDIPYLDLKTIVDFIYRGEITVEEKQLESLQRSVQALEVSCMYAQTLLLQKTALEQSGQRGFSQASTGGSLQQALLTQCHQKSEPTFQKPHQHAPYQCMYQSNIGSHVVEIVSSQSNEQPCVIYQPHEPFVQLKELLSRDTPHAVGVIRQTKENQATTVGQPSDLEEATTDEEFEVDIPRSSSAKISSAEGSSQIAVIDGNCKLENNGETHQVTNTSNNHYVGSLHKSEETPATNSDYIIRVQPTNEEDIDDNKNGNTSVTITSVLQPKPIPNLPMSVTIRSMPSATARAIAASTKLAMASGLLSSNNSSSTDESGHSQVALKSENEFATGHPMPFKRGRGRPPRHLKDTSGDEMKTYKVRPICPSSSTASPSTAGIVISSEPTACKRGRPDMDSAFTSRGRSIKAASYGSESHVKNVCPYCPQVYYSTQAMNDHINNVHTHSSKKYICEVCSKEFSWKISLIKHLRKSHERQHMSPQRPEDEDDEPLPLMVDEGDKQMVLS